MGKLWRNQFRRFARLLCLRDHWNIGVVDAPITKFLDPKFFPRVHWLLSPPSGGYYADPFHCASTGENNATPSTSVLVEEYDYDRAKGSISWLSLMKEQGSLRIHDSGSAITLPIHLSYPYIFRHDDACTVSRVPGNRMGSPCIAPSLHQGSGKSLPPW